MLYVRPVVRYLLSDVIGSVFYFPVWWYTVGLLSAVRWAVRQWSYQAKSFAIGLWIRSFYVPMYGQYDWAGRLMSIFMRFVVIVGRLIALVALAVAYFFLVCVWIVLPPIAFFFFFLHMFSSMMGY